MVARGSEKLFASERGAINVCMDTWTPVQEF
jgi:hypothetical protein